MNASLCIVRKIVKGTSTAQNSLSTVKIITATSNFAKEKIKGTYFKECWGAYHLPEKPGWDNC